MPAPDTGLAAMRRAGDRALMQRITAFLEAHDLPPTADYLLIARAYAAGEDRALSEAIDARLRERRPISPAFLDTLPTSAHAERLGAATLAELADTLGATLAESSRTIDRSCDSARAYEAALDGEVRDMAADPRGSLDRLVALTTAAIERSQLLAGELESMARESDRLRSRLTAARRAAEQDHLTKLPNRRSFDARMARSGVEQPRCVALCDIDDFKRVNDRHGHDAGDRVLKVVARHLKTALGGRVMVARHGGEEFACLFEGTTLHAARLALDDACERLAERSFVNQVDGVAIGRVTLSIGVAALRDDPSGAMRAADAALYAAKRAGKNRVVVAAGETDTGEPQLGG
ncbi:GGDEF domain-containing protein [Sphingomonas liriopis]|nr:GGDEF domain-containing protein [Sphingomonas liriopis]